jgi:hypothetical protein
MYVGRPNRQRVEPRKQEVKPKDVTPVVIAVSLMRLASGSTGKAQAEYLRRLRALLPNGMPLANVLDERLRRDGTPK